jgi:hypothetical protein
MLLDDLQEQFLFLRAQQPESQEADHIVAALGPAEREPRKKEDQG